MKSTDSRTILPKGTKLIGHVTRVASRSKGDSDTMLGMQFDNAKTKEGQEIPLGSLVVQAVAAPASTASSFGAGPAVGPSGGAAGNPGSSGSRGSQPQTGSQQSSNYPAPEAGEGGQGGSGPLPSNARGIYGLSDLSLATNAGTGETVVTSKGKNVHLDSGTRLLLMPQQQAPVGAPGQ